MHLRDPGFISKIGLYPFSNKRKQLFIQELIVCQRTTQALPTAPPKARPFYKTLTLDFETCGVAKSR
jgi:hypothetical protein